MLTDEHRCRQSPDAAAMQLYGCATPLPGGVAQPHSSQILLTACPEPVDLQVLLARVEAGGAVLSTPPSLLAQGTCRSEFRVHFSLTTNTDQDSALEVAPGEHQKCRGFKRFFAKRLSVPRPSRLTRGCHGPAHPCHAAPLHV